ncbi:MAG: hypothetical protein RIQ79_835, partial [Verrucomicrobiota bacterium]
MKNRLLALFLSLIASLPAAAKVPFDPALKEPEWMLQTLLYTYYWYLDDAFFAATADHKFVEVWVRSTEPAARDAGDKSGFAEIWVPDAKVLLALKKADYFVPELNLPVQSKGYRVRSGGYEFSPPAPAAEWEILQLPRDGVIRSLKEARRQVHVPVPATQRIVMDMLREEMRKAGVDGTPQRFFIAGRPGVAADVWVFWENRRVLLQICGDMDITQPELAAHLPLLVRQYNLASNVAASLIEAEGSNSLISRDRASRVLFLCIARGEEIVLAP